LKGKYDFIHSYIVFQHIPVERGKRIFEKLLAHLETGGEKWLRKTGQRYKWEVRV
jgi:hypothetical protein